MSRRWVLIIVLAVGVAALLLALVPWGILYLDYAEYPDTPPELPKAVAPATPAGPDAGGTGQPGR